MKTFFPRFLGFAFFTVLFFNSYSAAENVASGFHLEGRKILDAKGNEFLMRGVNHAHTWYTSQLNTAIPAIANAGSNCVRVVLSNGKHGEGWSKNSANEIRNIIQLCKDNKLIPILEIHDCTGYPEKSGAQPMSTAVDYWLEMKDEIIGQEEYVILNIANEPFGNNVPVSTWVDEHKDAISTLRNAGFKNLFIVDAANWGQDWEGTMMNNAQAVFDSDPDKNTVFSIHMYDVYGTASKVSTYIKDFTDQGLPLIVGEFAADHGSSGNVDEDAILSSAKEYGIGYIGWSWKGNGSGLESLDIANTWDGSNLSTWGNRLINGTDGIKETSVVASVFDPDIPTSVCPKNIQKNVNKNMFSVSLIPGAWNITYSAKSTGNVKLTLSSINGKTVLSSYLKAVAAGFSTFTVKNSSLATGSYLLSLESRTGNFSTVVLRY